MSWISVIEKSTMGMQHPEKRALKKLIQQKARQHSKHWSPGCITGSDIPLNSQLTYACQKMPLNIVLSNIRKLS